MITEQEFRKMQKKTDICTKTGTALQLLGISLFAWGFIGILWDLPSPEGLSAKTAAFLIFAFIFCIGGYLLEKTTRKKYNRSYKNNVMNRVASELFDEHEFHIDRGFSAGELRDKGLITVPLRFRSDDLIKGLYHDVGFMRADFALRKTMLNISMSTKGNWTVFTFPKPFTTDLQVSCGFMKTESRIRTGALTSKEKKRHILLTGDEEFDREFTCSCQNDEEALSLLTPGVRKKLLAMRYLRRVSFVMGWVDGELHLVVINGMDTAAPPVRKDASLETELGRIKEDLSVICEIIDELIMSRSIFADYVMAELEKIKNQPYETDYDVPAGEISEADAYKSYGETNKEEKEGYERLGET